jgi:hypothetical protein
MKERGAYFNALSKTMGTDSGRNHEARHREFCEQLMAFFQQRDLSDYNRFDFPLTEAREMLVRMSRGLYKEFLEDSIGRFLEPYGADDAYQACKEYARDHGYVCCSAGKLAGFLNDLGVAHSETKKRLPGHTNPVAYYYLTEEGKVTYQRLIDEYNGTAQN